jgi:hypothetical protein
LISTFGEDERGELYVADLNGTLYRLHGETFCSVGAKTLEIANFSERSVGVEIEIWRKGSWIAEGSFVLPASSSPDYLTLSGGPPPGEYEVTCRFVQLD